MTENYAKNLSESNDNGSDEYRKDWLHASSFIAITAAFLWVGDSLVTSIVIMNWCSFSRCMYDHPVGAPVRPAVECKNRQMLEIQKRGIELH